MKPLDPENVYSVNNNALLIVEREDIMYSVDLGFDVVWLSGTPCACVFTGMRLIVLNTRTPTPVQQDYMYS